MKAKRIDAPGFDKAWSGFVDNLTRVLDLAKTEGANRQAFDQQVDATVKELEALKGIIPAPTLAIGQRVRVTLDHEYLGKTGTVINIFSKHGLALIGGLVQDEENNDVGLAYQITDLEPADPEAAPC